MAAVVPIFAAPAGAVVTTQCDAGQYPNRAASQSGLKAFCTAVNTDVTGRIDIHDAGNAVWHHSAARAATLGITPFNTVATRAVTSANATIHFVSGQIVAADVRRPITALSGINHLFKGGTFIKAFVNATTATLSQNACTTAGAVVCTTTTAITAKVEHTNNRWLIDATCSGNTITTTAPGFASTDFGKSLSGGPFTGPRYINVAPVNGALSASFSGAALTTPCTNNNGGDTTTNPDTLPVAGADKIEVGAAQYDTGTGLPIWNDKDPMLLQLSNTTGGGAGFTCAGGNVLGMTAASKADTGGFVATDVGLATSIRRTVGAIVTVTAGKVVTVNTAGNTTATLGATQCPALAAVNATNSQAAIVGISGVNAPANNDAMMTLGAELNLSSALVPTGDDCEIGTIEGFMVVGGWVNPGATYAANASTPKASVAQILFPTSVLSFNGFVVPKRGGETNLPYSDANPHYTFTFPLLPTSLAECLNRNETNPPLNTDDFPLSPTGLSFTILPVSMSKAPFTPTGSGNFEGSAIRSLNSNTGPFDITVQQITSGGTVLSTDAHTCTVVSNSADPGFTCGDG